METRFLLRVSRQFRYSPLRHSQKRSTSNSTDSKKSFTQQANPIGDYYASILAFPTPPLPTIPPASITSQTKPGSTSRFETKSIDSKSEPKIIFSSRLSSPLERNSQLQRKSVLVAGVWVPPRPEEPDDCCMSGCVNCVWDRYGEELESWAVARKEADAALKKEKGFESEKKRRRKQPVAGTGLMLGQGEKGATHTAVSMDDDGGGSESNWGTGLETDFTSEELFKGVPVGIREFMKQEKRLKEKHAKDGTSGG